MFVTIGNVTQHTSDVAGQLLIGLSGGHVATAHEAAQCVHKLVANGSEGRHEANDDFDRIYGIRMSTACRILPLPNAAANGPRVSSLMRELEQQEGMGV